MKATETRLTKFLQGTHQFIIPIYQRTYSWTEKQCEQLWNDIIRVSQNEANPSHFIGSLVSIDKGQNGPSGVDQYLVIDGQQRLTTLTLLLSAFSKALKGQDSTEVTEKKITNRFLFNNEESKEERYKLILTQSDKDTLIRLLDGQELPEKYSANIKNNYDFFESKIEKSKVDLDGLYRGILKLMVVDISLNTIHDNPQRIFESLNSTGRELSQADLIRNYVLMGLDKEEQEYIYTNHWRPIEEGFDRAQATEYFDRFMRDYLTIKTGQIPNIKDVYSSFKEHVTNEQKPTRELVSDIHYFARFFCRLAFVEKPNGDLEKKIADINTLKVDVAYPFLLEVYSDFDRNLITKDEALEVFSMVESYVFRRAICGVPTNSLNKTFANLASEIKKDDYVESLKAAFVFKESYRRFPKNDEFELQLILKDVYNTRRILKYLLGKLENFDRKETVNVDEYTIEHIMPQNKNLSWKWKKDLGEKWAEVHSKYLHTIGNLTLTGYNPELSDKSFLEKRDMEGGFSKSPICLNSDLAALTQWNEDAILMRACKMTKKSLKIWKYPDMSDKELEKHSAIEDDVDEDIEEDEIKTPSWDSKLANASHENREAVNRLISMTNERFDCVSEPYGQWLFFYTKKPTERRNLFAVITCEKITANAIFRINPNLFGVDDERVRKVAGWFFPRGTERRMSIRPESLSHIIHYFDHAYSATTRSVP